MVSDTQIAYPIRLLIYHSGTGRTVFLGCLKVTTIFIFAFFSLVVAPAHFYADEEQPKWVAPTVLLCGTIPMVVVAYLSSPFVNYIHLILPTFARTSRDLMLRYSKNPPKDAMLDVTTMNFIGKPRVSRVYISDLRPTKQRLGIVNYVRDTKEINKSRSWWMGRAVRVFGVHSGTGKVRGGEAWENIARKINKS
ncbi:4-coumarate- ligase 2 protein [Rutstroemia sp. NJR-2017a BBW]|nr:4-coumarate- ligase 2 protein [Rutstroemia sp. NJR-2017a BBW]